MRQRNCLFSTILLGLWLLSLTPLTQAQTPAQSNPSAFFPLNPVYFGVHEWKVGESSVYHLVLYQDKRKEVKQVRYAILGAEKRGSDLYYMVENQVTDLNEDRHSSVNSVTRPFGDLTNLLDQASGDLIIQQDRNPPRSIPISLLKDRLPGGQSLIHPSKIASVESIGKESIETPAGRFQAVHEKLYFEDGHMAEVWRSGNVGPLGLVKVISRDFSLILTEYRPKRAASAIVEIPRPLQD